MEAGQRGGEAAAMGAGVTGAGLGGGLIVVVVGGLAGRNGLLEVLKRQAELVWIELLGTAAKLHALQLTQQMQQAIVLRQRLIARRNGGVALGERRRKPRV